MPVCLQREGRSYTLSSSPALPLRARGAVRVTGRPQLGRRSTGGDLVEGAGLALDPFPGPQ